MGLLFQKRSGKPGWNKSPAKRVRPGLGDTGGPGPSKKVKSDPDGPAVPAYSVIQATNPISALYEYCRKSKCTVFYGKEAAVAPMNL